VLIACCLGAGINYTVKIRIFFNMTLNLFDFFKRFSFYNKNGEIYGKKINIIYCEGLLKKTDIYRLKY
jgi:hypothetical protein